MMKQYTEIKKQYQDCLLLYRMGDFYELFMKDAHIGAKILNITLTGKANGKNKRIPMAGVPYHAVDAYLAKLVKAGYKVAICEQLSPPNKKGLVKRDVVRIVTPGTVLDEHTLEKKENNYLVSILTNKTLCAMSVADLSTGYFATTQFPINQLEQTLLNTLASIMPSECILPEQLYNDPEFLTLIKRQQHMNIFPFFHWDQFANDAEETLQKHFGVSTLKGFDLADKKPACQAAAALLGYLKETQKATITHIKHVSFFGSEQSLTLDRSTMVNLELFSTIREHTTKGTLISVLDQTVTAMGGRLLRLWIKQPLVAKQAITERHDAVAVLLQKREERKQLRDLLQEVSDIERLVSRLSVGLGNGRDVINLKQSLEKIILIKKNLQQFDSKLINQLANGIKTHGALDALISYIDSHILPEPPISIREGRMIQKGVHKELDRLRTIISGSREFIMDLEKKEREKTGIASLKVRFNQVFGFYIEVSKANLASVPKHYMRKQTLVNAERFITPELKEQEEIILTAEEKVNDLEYLLFQKVVQHVLSRVDVIQQAAASIAALDCLAAFAYLAEKNRYVRPTVLYSDEIRLKESRHPVVETLLHDKQFVPNDVTLDPVKQQLLLLTGPNMAGKSVLIRQVALIVLMNQIGSFVPAKSAHLGITDRIFVRSGASDVITSGLSTFMVEMVETAYILNHATEKSLIIMDEIGRGTSTYDGISIASAIAEYLVTTTHAKTLFATHYHELQLLEERYPHIKNFQMHIAEKNGEPIFLHTLLTGGASHSFGVAVAKLAGIPEQVITRARELLEDLEKRNKPVILEGAQRPIESQRKDSIASPNHNRGQLQNDYIINRLIHKELENLDVANLTPLEALNKLAELKDKLKLFTEQSKTFLEKD